MPTSKSLTSSDDLQRAILEKKAAEGDYQFLLNELLAVIHRDGGHYTALAGHATSVADALRIVPDLYRKVADLSYRVGQLSRQTPPAQRGRGRTHT